MVSWKLPCRAALLTTLVLAVVGCARTRPLAPQIELQSLQLAEFSLSHAAIDAGLRLYNPNAFAIDVEEVAFSLALNGVRVASGHGARDLRIEADRYGETTLRLSSSYLDLLQLSNSLQGSREVDFLLEGDIKLDGFGLLPVTVPIRREGRIPLQGFAASPAGDGSRP